MYVYIKTESCLWTLGFYKPDGTWESESDHANSAAAANRVAYLNGSAAVQHPDHPDFDDGYNDWQPRCKNCGCAIDDGTWTDNHGYCNQCSYLVYRE